MLVLVYGAYWTGYVIYPGKLTDARCFRIGTIGRLYPQDIDALLEAVRSVVAESLPQAG